MSNSLLRRLVAPTAAAAIAATAAFVGAGAASAHVTANAPTLAQGGYGVVTFVVPNESDTAATTELTVTLPNLKSARPEAMSGWRSEVAKDPSTEAVTSITWTALPGTPGVPVGEFAQFRISGGPFPEEDSVMLPATQIYADGERVAWAEPMGADGEEPEHPAPTLTLPAATDGDDHHGGSASHGSTDTAGSAETTEASDSTDDAARWLGGIGLLVGALGAVIGVAALTRSGRRGGGSDTERGSDA
ncbi:YcnI family protein [Gordonia sp. PKS22-38]|uniref:YcnI family protein n=1 Tax=Gordonia prachuapensis TaxID=3115651 RepID=A0ABU7MUA2_9ACTN|nr:YcnI family protein [Gordonia sp. PKS22-38]